jgi:hypothetical protein
VLAAWRRATDSKVVRRLLDHVNQRFRFSCVLGSRPHFRVADFGDADEEEDGETPADLRDKNGSKPIDLRQINQILSKALTALKGRHNPRTSSLIAPDQNGRKIKPTTATNGKPPITK